MTDQLSSLFEQARTEALPSVRPPGAAAARRTVRRRRVSALVAVVAVAAGASLLFGPAPADVAPAEVVPAPEALLAEEALLTGGTNGPAIQSAGPAYLGYSRKETVYVPALTVRVACVGTGQITLAVHGRPDANGSPTELLREPVRCGPVPVVVEGEITSLPNPITSEIDIRLIEVSGKAHFAYQILAPRGVDALDPVNSPIEALKRPGEVVQSTEAGEIPPGEPWREAVTMVPGARYTVAAACAGSGTLVFEIRQPTGEVIPLRVPCSWPPIRRQITTAPTAAGATLWMRYETDRLEQAQYAWITV